MAGIIADVAVLILCGAALAEVIARGACAGGKADALAAAGPGLVALAATIAAEPVAAVRTRSLSGSPALLTSVVNPRLS